MQVFIHEALASFVGVVMTLLEISTLLNLSVNFIMFSVIVVGYCWINLLVDESNIEASLLGVETEFLEDTVKVLMNGMGVFEFPLLELLNSFFWDA